MSLRRLRSLFVICFQCCLFSRAQPIRTEPLWSYTSAAIVTGCPAIAPDGTIYLGTSDGVCALTSAGSNSWTFPAPQSTAFCSPAIDRDGTVYWGDDSANFYAINPDGTQKWKLALQPEFSYRIHYASSPAIGANGNIYFVASGRLYAVAADGVKLWEFIIDDTYSTPTIAISPIIGADGTIYIGSGYNQIFYAINPDGTQKWQFPAYDGCGESAALGNDGTIYFTCNVLVSLSPNGTQNWYSLATTFAAASPAVGADGTIFAVGDQRHKLYAIDASGQAKWSAAYGPSAFDFPSTCPALAADGMIYYSSSNSVFAISANGGVQWIFTTFYTGGPPTLPTPISPAIGPDGTIYAAFGSTLYAIQGNSNSLATAPWPMYRQNLRHTGKMERPALAPSPRRADGNFAVQVAGEPGQAYSLQSTSNLITWTSVTSFVARAASTTIADLTSSNAPKRFYRATTP